jgi:hypothetical protein
MLIGVLYLLYAAPLLEDDIYMEILGFLPPRFNDSLAMTV